MTPSSLVEVDIKDGWIQSIRSVVSEDVPPANVLSFDIETYNPQGMPDPKKDPLIMLSYADASESQVITYAQPPRPESFVQTVTGEKEVLERVKALNKGLIPANAMEAANHMRWSITLSFSSTMVRSLSKRSFLMDQTSEQMKRLLPVKVQLIFLTQSQPSTVPCPKRGINRGMGWAYAS